MSIKMTKEEFLKLGGARNRINYEEVKKWILAQGDFAISAKTLEERFNLRFSTFAWRAKKQGDGPPGPGRV